MKEELVITNQPKEIPELPVTNCPPVINTIQFSIPSNPISVNSYLKNTQFGRKFTPPKTKEYIEQTQISAKKHLLLNKSSLEQAQLPTSKPLTMSLTYYFSDKRRRDIDNYSKCILDALQTIIYNDDNQIQHLTLSKCIDKENPRTEVTIAIKEDNSE
jgi:Holliday junction resolvase RusA-like endonuclease|tara:strand:+ start:61 stop:534 length:474 start_codon:yes stop_codon:yes gene_type:complete